MNEDALSEPTNKVSDQASPAVPEEDYDENKAPEYIYVDMKSRTCGNKIARIFYNVFKSLHASVWFYFLPFAAIFLSYSIPNSFDKPTVDDFSY